MKAHHGGLEFSKHVGGLGAERCASRRGGNAPWIDSIFLVEGRKRCSPDRLALGIRRGGSVAKEVHVERFAGLRLDFRELLAHGTEAEHRTRQRAETTCIGYGHRQRAALHARHGRLNDRKVNAKKLGQFHRLIWGSGRRRARRLRKMNCGSLRSMCVTRPWCKRSRLVVIAFVVHVFSSSTNGGVPRCLPDALI